MIGGDLHDHLVVDGLHDDPELGAPFRGAIPPRRLTMEAVQTKQTT